MTEPQDDNRGRKSASGASQAAGAAGSRKKASGEAIASSHRQKVEDAFELVEKMEKHYPHEPESAPHKPKADHRKRASRSGLRFRFGLDAFVSDNDTRTTDEKDIRPGKATLLDIDVTVPYVWKIPIIGKRALRIVKYFQSQGAPESVRDILKTLRSKKPF